MSKYRLVCLQELLEYQSDYKRNRYLTYAYSLKENFDGIDSNYIVYRTNDSSGFKILKMNDTYVRVFHKKIITDICLSSSIKATSLKVDKYNINSKPDLFDYNYGFIFFVGVSNFSNHKNISFFKIVKETSKNYYQIYDYKEENINKLLCYYDQSKDFIICLYQTLNDIKYFTMYNSAKLYEIKSFTSKTIKIASNSERYFDANNMLNTKNIGDLNVIEIDRYQNEKIYKNEIFGIDYYELLMNNNNVFVNKSFNDWYDYHLSFIENIGNNFTRIFYIKETDIVLNIRTCFKQCVSCRTNYEICDDCKYENYSLLKGSTDTCFENGKLHKGYIYNENIHYFENCYSSCDFCSSSSINDDEHKCLACANGYLPSYNNLGNCYSSDDINFIGNSCLKYKINSTGVCVEECPTSNFYYSFDYN
jgi:hypothetical protein